MEKIVANSFYTAEQARAFAERWLPAWSGNNPEGLAAFYTDDVYYEDAGIPGGAQGKPALLAYFRKLLGQNPDWVWTQRRAAPMEDGFVNYWHAAIPVGPQTLEVDGVCLVQLRNGLIYRNEVFFDRTELVSAIRALHRAKP